MFDDDPATPLSEKSNKKLRRFLEEHPKSSNKEFLDYYEYLVSLDDHDRRKANLANEKVVVQSHGWRDFIIGLIVMALVILLAIALAGNSWSPTTGNTGPVSGNCNDPSGAGC